MQLRNIAHLYYNWLWDTVIWHDVLVFVSVFVQSVQHFSSVFSLHCGVRCQTNGMAYCKVRIDNRQCVIQCVAIGQVLIGTFSYRKRIRNAPSSIYDDTCDAQATLLTQTFFGKLHIYSLADTIFRWDYCMCMMINRINAINQWLIENIWSANLAHGAPLIESIHAKIPQNNDQDSWIWNVKHFHSSSHGIYWEK